mgnify:CR=1 FL=1
MKKNEHLIKEVYPGSIAEEMGIEPGDVLLRINKQEIGDVFDYRYYIKDDYIEVRRKKNGNIRLRIFCDCSKMNINHSKRTEYISYTFLISGTYTNLYYEQKKYSKKNIRLKEEKKQQRKLT